MKHWFVAMQFLALLTFSSLSTASELRAVVDKNRIAEDESVVLQVTLEDDPGNDVLDTSPLLKDFIVGQTQVSRRTEMINWNTRQFTQWTTVIYPRRTGKITIPSLSVGSYKSDPITLDVVPLGQIQQRRDLFLTTEVDTSSVYVQQQIRYTAKLYIATAVQRGGLTPPTMPDASVEMIGKEREYSDYVDGQRYRIIEYTFAITPQKSGSYSIRGPVFDAEVIDNQSGGSGLFRNTKRVSRVGPGIDVQVNAIPASYSQHWLPSEYVALSEKWSAEPTEFRVGVPITREMILSAVGVSPEQLPGINAMFPPSMKTYPDQGKTGSVEKDGNLLAQRSESVAIIPDTPGLTVLPEVSIPWFNVVTGETEYAILPSRSINVLPALNAAQTNLPPAISDTPESPVASEKSDTAEPQPPALQSSDALPATSVWWSPSSWILLLVWLLTLTLWWNHSRRRSGAKQESANSQAIPTISSAEIKTRLHTALLQNQANKATVLLKDYLGMLTGNRSQSISSSLIKLDDAKLSTLVNEMLASQYANQPSAWQGRPLAEYLGQLAKAQRTSPQASLKPLYPVT